jgi:hypothetical protein
MPESFPRNGALTPKSEDSSGDDILATQKSIGPSGLAAYKERE